MKKTGFVVLFFLFCAGFARGASGEMESRLFDVKYGEARSIFEVLQHLKSEEGRLSVHSQSGTIIAVDRSEILDNMAATIRVLDVAPKQVMINVMIAEVTDVFLSGIGITFGQAVIPREEFRQVRPLFDNAEHVIIRSEMQVRTVSGKPANINVNKNVIYGGRVIAQGRVAVILPAIERTAGDFLEVLPGVNKDGTITISVRPEKSRFAIDGSIQESSILTQVIVNSGDVIALGGFDMVDERVVTFDGAVRRERVEEKRIMMFLRADVIE